MMAVDLGTEIMRQSPLQHLWKHSNKCTQGDMSVLEINSYLISPLYRPIVVSCGDKFTMIVVEPYSDDAEFKKRQLKSSERSEGSKVRVSHSSVMGECLSMAYIHRVVDQTICAKPTRAKLHRAATSLTVSTQIVLDNI